MNERSEALIERLVSDRESGFDAYRNDLEEIYQEGFEAGKKAALNWQDISTAPKDGSTILLNIPSMAIGCWENNAWFVSTAAPTGWMPKPLEKEV